MGIQYVIWSYGHIIIAWWVGMLKTAKIQPEIQRVKFNPIERAVKYVDVKMKRTKWPPLIVSENSFPKWSKCPFFNVLCEQENSVFCSFFWQHSTWQGVILTRVLMGSFLIKKSFNKNIEERSSEWFSRVWRFDRINSNLLSSESCCLKVDAKQSMWMRCLLRGPGGNRGPESRPRNCRE